MNEYHGNLSLSRRLIAIFILVLIQIKNVQCQSKYMKIINDDDVNQKSGYLKDTSADDALVQTNNGMVQGSITQYGRSFKGIPFAEPPVANNRWNSPQPVQSWSNVLNATQWKPGCPQHCVLPPHSCPLEQSEDCLYLNIYTPSVSQLKELQPVMFFLHGGRFEQGSAASILYDGGFMSNRSNCIIVTTNYRLGALGWLALNENMTGNFALMDQRQALMWVKENIKNFGGNSNQITIFGQSAGASSIVAHMTSPITKGLDLFQQAIVESDPMTLPMKPLADAIALGTLYAQDAGCSSLDLDCLRSVNVNDLINAQQTAQKYINYLKPLEEFLPWTPTVDGKEVVMQALDAFSSESSENYMNIPLMIGTVSEEVLLFIYEADHSKLTDADYLAVLAAIFLEDSGEVVDMYPPNPIFGDKRPEISVLGNDYIFFGSIRNAVSHIVQNNSEVYTYQFSHVMSNDVWGPNYSFCVGHVCHGSELPFVWHIDGYNFTQEEEVLSISMIDYWTNFARSGNPNSPRFVDLKWPNYDNINKLGLNFSTPNSILQDLRSSYLNFWDSLGYLWGW